MTFSDAPWLDKVARPMMFGGERPTAGKSLDRIDVAAGLRELEGCGYTEPHTRMVIEHALMRWARGEEEAAQRGALDEGFHGINLVSWLRVVSAARASAEQLASRL